MYNEKLFVSISVSINEKNGAEQLGMAIKWRRSQDENTLLFAVVPVADEGLIDRAGEQPEHETRA